MKVFCEEVPVKAPPSFARTLANEGGPYMVELISVPSTTEGIFSNFFLTILEMLIIFVPAQESKMNMNPFSACNP